MAKIKSEDVKVKVTFTEGYRQRFTAACLKQLELREKRQRREQPINISLFKMAVADV